MNHDSDGRPAHRLGLIRPYAERLLKRLEPACHDIEIAGSIRRQAAQCHDIDLVLDPITAEHRSADLFGNVEGVVYNTPGLDDAIDKLCTGDAISVVKRGERMICLLIETPLLTTTAELYLTNRAGDNWGALLQMRTGPAELNRFLARRAQQLGLRYRAGLGVYDPAGNRLDRGNTEKALFEALDLAYSMPQHRHLPDVLSMYEREVFSLNRGRP